MRTERLGRRALTSCVAAAVLAGCGGSRPPAGLPGIGPRAPEAPLVANLLVRETASRLVRRSGCYSWMDPSAKTQELLYVSNYEGQSVTVYGWRSGKLLGTLSCFYQPTGLCVDREQNVYVTDFDTGNTTEFAHGGATPVKILKETIGYPWDCAVDRKTGDVAVVNLYDWLNDRDVPGSVLIYPHGKQKPIQYQADLQYYYNVAYDETGDLYVVGIGSGVELWELRNGSRALESIRIPDVLRHPGGVHWDGKYLVVGDSSADAIYQFKIVGSQAKLIATIPLNETGRIYQFWLPKFGPGTASPQPKRVVAVDWDTDQLFKWAYPDVAVPLQEYVTGMAEPNAVALSRPR